MHMRLALNHKLQQNREPSGLKAAAPGSIRRSSENLSNQPPCSKSLWLVKEIKWAASSCNSRYDPNSCLCSLPSMLLLLGAKKRESSLYNTGILYHWDDSHGWRQSCKLGWPCLSSFPMLSNLMLRWWAQTSSCYWQGTEQESAQWDQHCYRHPVLESGRLLNTAPVATWNVSGEPLWSGILPTLLLGIEPSTFHVVAGSITSMLFIVR